jgi:hypothetical protein
MNNFDFVEDVLKKAKSSYDISEDKQLQQENIAALQSGDLAWIDKQRQISINKYREQINFLSKITNVGIFQKTDAMPENVLGNLDYITRMIPTYVICRELQGEARDHVLKIVFPNLNTTPNK